MKNMNIQLHHRLTSTRTVVLNIDLTGFYKHVQDLFHSIIEDDIKPLLLRNSELSEKCFAEDELIECPMTYFYGSQQVVPWVRYNAEGDFAVIASDLDVIANRFQKTINAEYEKVVNTAIEASAS